MNIAEVRVYYNARRQAERVELIDGQGNPLQVEHAMSIDAPVVAGERRTTVTLRFRCPIRHVYHDDDPL